MPRVYTRQPTEFTDTYNHTRPHRSLAKRTPAKVASGRITLRNRGRLHHIGLGYEHNGIIVRAAR